jgi:hypothetical protein
MLSRVFFLIMCIVALFIFPKLSRLKKLDSASYSSVPLNKFYDWHQLEMKSLKIMALVCKIYLIAFVPMFVIEGIAVVNDNKPLLFVVDILYIAYSVFFIISAIRQYNPAKRAKKMKKEFGISY